MVKIGGFAHSSGVTLAILLNMSYPGLSLSQTGFYLVTQAKVTLAIEKGQEVWRINAKLPDQKRSARE